MTDRSVAAAIDSSPLFHHETLQCPEEPTVANFPEFQRQVFRALFESFTIEEMQALFNVMSSLSLLLRSLSLSDLVTLAKVGHAFAQVFVDPDVRKINSANAAYMVPWRKVGKYRVTGCE
jgi:hypothetical protein